MEKKSHNHEDILIPARDGYTLAATYYKADNGENRLVVISSATAVPRQFYREYAEHLAQEGFSVLTYDYRGINDSKPKKLRGFRARMRDWALQDMAGIIDWAKSEIKPDQLYLIGHSVGGQVAGMLDNVADIDGMVTFSAQSGHWRHQGGAQKLAVFFHSYVTLPLAAAVMGYMPWSWLGAEDLPGKVAKEWAGWCRDRNYLLGDDSLPLERYSKFSAPVLAYSFSDDNWGTAKAVDAMMRAYPNRERRHVQPKDAGLKKLGHFGYFKSSSLSLWGEAVDWLNAQ